MKKMSFMVTAPYHSHLEYMKALLKMVQSTGQDLISLKMVLPTKVNIATTEEKVEESY